MGTFELRILSIGLRKICQSIPGTKRESKVKMAGLPVDYYAALGIPSSASQQQIRDAYKRAALKTHPDRVASDSPERAERTRKFQLINDAYYTLSDPSRRSDYDSARKYHGFGSGASTASTAIPTTIPPSLTQVKMLEPLAASRGVRSGSEPRRRIRRRSRSSGMSSLEMCLRRC